MKNIRLLAILLLDDENGINGLAYNALAAELAATGNDDILLAVRAQDGRYFIGEDDAESLARCSKIPDGVYSLAEVTAEALA